MRPSGTGVREFQIRRLARGEPPRVFGRVESGIQERALRKSVLEISCGCESGMDGWGRRDSE